VSQEESNNRSSLHFLGEKRVEETVDYRINKILELSKPFDRTRLMEIIRQKIDAYPKDDEAKKND